MDTAETGYSYSSRTTSTVRAWWRIAIGVTVAICVAAATGLGQASPVGSNTVTAADYARAERLMGYNTAPLVLHGGVRPTWVSNGRFWYRVMTERGAEFVLVDPATGTRSPAFDQAKLAAALTAAGSPTADAFHLPFTTFELSGNRDSVAFSIADAHWRCDLRSYQCAHEAGPSHGAAQEPEVRSPDGTRAVFVRGFNLWVRDIATGQERQLTHDGMENFGYATDNAGWTHSDRAIVLWSPDSRRIATYQQDQRGVGEMYLVETTAGHPRLHAWKYPLPGDDTITTIQRVVVDVDSARVVRLRMPADQH